MEVSASAFAAMLKVSPTTITNWMDAGMPAVRTGRQKTAVRISLDKALPWVIAHRQTQGSERERLAAEQADKFALANAVKRGELIHVDQVAEVFSWMGAELSSRHDAVAGRLAGELSGLTDPAVIRGRLLEELRAIRSAVADATAKLADALGSGEASGQDSEPAEGEVAKPVGRRKSRAAARKRRARAVPE